MSGAFTPGPWRTEAKRVGQFDVVAGPDYFSRVFVAFVGCGDDIPSEANARLIAAAPDMFNVLTLLQSTELDDRSGLLDVYADAKTALAKARGDACR